MKKDLIILLSFHAITSFRLQSYEYKSNKYSFVAIAISNDFIALMQFGELHIDKKYYPIWREQKDAWV